MFCCTIAIHVSIVKIISGCVGGESISGPNINLNLVAPSLFLAELAEEPDNSV